MSDGFPAEIFYKIELIQKGCKYIITWMLNKF